ncbi:MAG: hypothetical protein NWE81_01780, partial [Candidatus Bathyarchaeota archaeon]|nr:hypothetical protein [Candidatus Bathyarchaeota archaeon]
GPVLSTWIYEAHRFSEFALPPFDNLAIRGAGIPFFISSVLGLLSLFLLLAFVKEPKRNKKRTG